MALLRKAGQSHCLRRAARDQDYSGGISVKMVVMLTPVALALLL